MSAQASSDLIWRVVKGNNAFLTKQRAGRGGERTVLSTETNNLTGKSSFKHSGLAHAGVGLQLEADGTIKIIRGKDSSAISAKKPGQVGKKATEGRKDLRTASKALTRRLVRLTTRKSRKSWQKASQE
eukprot:TRINITY_DN2_c1_g1_i1.p1 TRINITY_DN2_c1_g1~~TRINITY_DN2_c1_g1_i1.p1  ORF type:complete len:128 (+),score=48.37 TRINITY_DN2_c1_g1_i1:105-488(+)